MGSKGCNCSVLRAGLRHIWWHGRCLVRMLMKLPTRMTSMGLRAIVLVGMVAAGCGDDNRGVRLGQMDGDVLDAVPSSGGQTGSTSSHDGTAGANGGGQAGGVTGTAGGIGTKSSGNPGGSVDDGGLGTKSTGGVAGSGGTVGSGGSKGGILAGADAGPDVSTSDGGGKPDGAADAGANDAPWFETRAVPDSSVALDGKVVCGPICDIYCSYGNVLDANGCPTCACNVQPLSCPVLDCPSCPRGNLRNSAGCLTCTCVPDPSLPCNTFKEFSLCSASTHCRWLERGCGLTSSTDISASETGCYERADCTKDSDCSVAGTTCVKRSVNPHPPDRVGDWCSTLVYFCL
jgi:hypothetical protein